MNIKNFLITSIAGSLLVWTALHAQSPSPTPPESRPDSTTVASLTDFERSLIGTWYFSGDTNQPCYIACANNLVFAIAQNRRAARILCNPAGYFLAEEFEHGMRAEVSHDKILWSNGTWWSRHPMVAGSIPSEQK
jgi:hypothetical protein